MSYTHDVIILGRFSKNNAHGIAALSRNFIHSGANDLPLLHHNQNFVVLFNNQTADEIAAQGTDFLLGSVHSHRFHGNYHDEAARLWGRDGTLLATGTQLMYFKG